MAAFTIWFILALFVLCSIIMSEIRREEFEHILIHNAIVFFFVCCIEFLFLKEIILNYAPINQSDMSAAIHNAVHSAL